MIKQNSKCIEDFFSSPLVFSTVIKGSNSPLAKLTLSNSNKTILGGNGKEDKRKAYSIMITAKTKKTSI